MSITSFIGYANNSITDGRLVTKCGGVPKGFDFARWPKCEVCGERQEFLLQLDLHSPLKLAQKYRWAFVFACSNVDCDPFLDDSGANAVILVTGKDAFARLLTDIPEGIASSSPEQNFTLQAYTENDKEWPRAPELFLGVAPDYHFDLVAPCQLCEGESSVIAQFEHKSKASFVAVCNLECRDDAAFFMW